MQEQKKSKPKYRRVVAKFGTNLLTGGSDHLDEKVMADLVGQVAGLHEQGVELVIVSSGAIASGRHKMGLTKKGPQPKGVPLRQVLAAVGQSGLMYAYEQLFGRHGITVAQALLTKRDLTDRAGYLNARNTLLGLMEMGVICIVNENDVVAVEEIEGARFGDNDNLSAMVANLVDADLLLLLTDTIGLCTADPRKDPTATLIREVDKIDAQIEQLAGGSVSGRGTGGMITKIEAAKLATNSSVTVVIADGRAEDTLLKVAGGESIGTRFKPVSTKVESRKRWMVSGLNTKGRLTVDDGAALALKKNKGSLLAAGITGVDGDFHRGDTVNIYDAQGALLGCGIVNYDSIDALRIKGANSKKIAALLGHAPDTDGAEVVHRNNLVVL